MHVYTGLYTKDETMYNDDLQLFKCDDKKVKFSLLSLIVFLCILNNLRERYNFSENPEFKKQDENKISTVVSKVSSFVGNPVCI